MIKEIQLKGLASAPSGHSSDDGLLSVSIGCMPEQGELMAIPPLSAVLTLQGGQRAVLRHTVGGCVDNYIVTSRAGSATVIMWTRPGMAEPALIATVEAECRSFAACGRMVVAATDAGLRFMSWRGGDYAYLGAAPALPEMQFGMQRAGYVTIAERFELPAHMAAMASQPSGTGAGAWLTHPSAQGEAQSGEAAAKAIDQAFAQALAAQAEGKGLFYQPFLVRYGLRLPDGSLPWVSAPVLMCPWALPPCLALESVADADGKKVATLSATSCPVFRLRRRFLSGLPQAWAEEVASVDVFITPQIATWDPSQPGRGFASYKSVAGAADGDFAGCWAEAGDAYAEHTLADAGLSDATAWQVGRSGDLASALRQASEFYLAESIPVERIDATAGFESAVIASTAAKAIEGGEKLDACAGMPWELVPESVDAACGRVFAVGGKMRMPAPASLMSASAASGSAAADGVTEVAVWLKRGGEVAVTRRQWEAGSAPDLSASFPRMLAYPCREAYMMQVSQGGRHWSLPLAPHPALDCACWWGGLSANPGAGCESLWVDDPDPAESPLLDAADCYAPSAGAAAFAFGRPQSSQAGRVRGVRAAVGALSPGQLGQFAAYALCSRGVMALGAIDFAPKQLLTSHGCCSAAGIASFDSGVAYASDSGLMLLRGWKCECAGSLDYAGRVRRLPELSRLAAMAGASLPIPTLARALRDGSIAYDSRRSRLLVLSAETPCAYVYSLAGGQWGMAMLQATGTAIGSGCIMLADGTLADAALEGDGQAPCLVVTHPIKAEKPVLRKRLAAAMAEGRIDCHSVSLAVYGSNDLVGWSLVASSTGRSIESVAGSPWRYYAGALAGRLGPADAISALTFNFR